MQKVRNYLRFVYNSPRYLLIHVLFLISIAFLVVESQHEDTLYHNIIRATKQNVVQQADTVFIRKLMVNINSMMYNRLAVFQNTENLSWKNDLFNSVDADLMYGTGACGGFSKVFARSLRLSGYKVRIGQMKANGYYGAHIIVEVFLPTIKRWVVIDPLFLLTFASTKDGHWAGFDEIKQNWAHYQQHLPSDYDKQYRYEDVRYTNWEKVPLVGSVGFDLLQKIMGKERAASISIRVLILNKYYSYLCVFGAAYFLFIFSSVRRFRRKHRPAYQPASRSLAA
jgi:hypothetical protein